MNGRWTKKKWWRREKKKIELKWRKHFYIFFSYAERIWYLNVYGSFFNTFNVRMNQIGLHNYEACCMLLAINRLYLPFIVSFFLFFVMSISIPHSMEISVENVFLKLNQMYLMVSLSTFFSLSISISDCVFILVFGFFAQSKH